MRGTLFGGLHRWKQPRRLLDGGLAVHLVAKPVYFRSPLGSVYYSWSSTFFQSKGSLFWHPETEIKKDTLVFILLPRNCATFVFSWNCGRDEPNGSSILRANARRMISVKNCDTDANRLSWWCFSFGKLRAPVMQDESKSRFTGFVVQFLLLTSLLNYMILFSFGLFFCGSSNPSKNREIYIY